MIALLAGAWVLEGSLRRALVVLAICAAVFRFDTLPLLGILLVLGSQNMRQFLGKTWMVIKTGLIAACKPHMNLYLPAPLTIISIILIVTTAPIDSLLYGFLCWPELDSFYFNVILNRSKEWGTSPWHYYWVKVLPFSLMLGYLPSLAGVFLMEDQRGRLLGISALLLTTVFSLVPHKEPRFIFSVIPYLIMASAVLLARGIRAKRRFVKYGALLLTISMIALQLLVFPIKLYASHYNYPGGMALREIASRSPLSHIYVSNAVFFNGYSRFLGPRDDLQMSFEYEQRSDLDSAKNLETRKALPYTHMLMDSVNNHSILHYSLTKSWSIFNGISCDFTQLLSFRLSCFMKLRPFANLLEPDRTLSVVVEPGQP